MRSTPSSARTLIETNAPADVVRQRISTRRGRVEPLDAQRCRLITWGDDLGWLAFYLGMLGFELEVNEPPELAEYFLRLSERFARAGAPRTAQITATSVSSP